MKAITWSIFKEDCMGCHACEVACKQEHQLVLGPRLIRVIEKSSTFHPVYCHQCVQAPCLKACPVQAIDRNERGIILINKDNCIGCRECIGACLFGAMQFDDFQKVATKCDLCHNRIIQGQAPACSLVCPTGCIVWGDSSALGEPGTPHP